MEPRSNRGIPDPIQLSYAAVQGRVLVTGDWDFLNYAYAVHPHAGVTILPRNVSIGEAILYLEILPHTRRAEDYANQLLVYPAL